LRSDNRRICQSDVSRIRGTAVSARNLAPRHYRASW